MSIRSVSSRIVYENRWLRLREDQIEREGGLPGIYSVIEKPDFALVIPAENDGFYLVEQYRYPVKGRYWEFPQGTSPSGTDGSPSDLARSELAEETGLRAGTLDYLGRLHASYGTSNQGMQVFLATDLVHGEAHPEPEEVDLIHRWFARDDFEAMIRDGKITDNATLAAYLLMTLRAHRAKQRQR